MTRIDRRPATRRGAACAVALAGVLGLSGCGGSPVRAGAAAVVGSDRISTEELATVVTAGLADPGASQLAGDRPGYQRSVLSRLLTAQVVDAAARQEGVSVTEGDVETQFRMIEQAVGGPDQLRAQAGAAGLTVPQVHDLARTRAQTTALGDRLTEGVDVPRAQLQQAYDAGIDGFDRVRTAQVQLAGLAEAQALLPQAQALSDAAFADLARARSQDESTRADGGDLGLQPRSAFAGQGLADYGNAAFAARVGDTFAVASPRGGHVVRVLARETTTLEQATTRLRRVILRDRIDRAVQQLLTGTAARLHITVNPRFGAWDAQSLAVVERSDTGNRLVSSPGAPAGGPGAPGADVLTPPAG